jgi:hypothetical protein
MVQCKPLRASQESEQLVSIGARVESVSEKLEVLNDD